MFYTGIVSVKILVIDCSILVFYTGIVSVRFRSKYWLLIVLYWCSLLVLFMLKILVTDCSILVFYTGIVFVKNIGYCSILVLFLYALRIYFCSFRIFFSLSFMLFSNFEDCSFFRFYCIKIFVSVFKYFSFLYCSFTFKIFFAYLYSNICYRNGFAFDSG